jgi:hypothetical protein
VRKASIAFVVVGVLLLAVPALAQSNSILIEITGINYSAEGKIIRVASVDVDPGMVGWLCTGTAQTENNASEHDDNDFILTSGTSSAEILNWEAVAGAMVSMSGTLVLGESITVDLRMGPDRVSSGGVGIVLTCGPPPPPETTTTTSTTTTTTTTPPESTTTTAPETTTTTLAPTTTQPPAATTTTDPPPEGGVSAGGGSTAGTGITPAEVLVGAGITALATALGLVFLGRQRNSPRN